ncbi:MAG: hypothetical protein NVV83_19580 [Afipia sp.]|nr:hypothetical protein [Afipia sp.]
MDAPGSAIVNDLAGRIEWQTVETAECVDLAPVGAKISVLQRDMIGAARLLPVSAAAALKESATLLQEFGQARDRIRNPPRLVKAQSKCAQMVTRRSLAMMDPCDLRSVGVGDHECLGVFLFNPPGRRKPAFFVA